MTQEVVIICDNCKRMLRQSEDDVTIQEIFCSPEREDRAAWLAFAVDGGSINNAVRASGTAMHLCPDCRQVVKWDPFKEGGSDFIPIGQELTLPG